MSQTSVYNLSGDKVSDIALPQDIFSVKINQNTLHQVVLAQQANARGAIAHTKTKANVRGGGIKPFKQKGTGRARAGSSRSPIWIGGGITFGPLKYRNFTKKINKKTRRSAIYMALSARLQDKNIILLDNLSFSSHKTKNAVKLLNLLPIKEGGSILVIISQNNPKVELAFANIASCKILMANALNIVDLLTFDWIIMDLNTMRKIEKVYLGKVITEEKIEKTTTKAASKTKKKNKTKKSK